MATLWMLAIGTIGVPSLYASSDWEAVHAEMELATAQPLAEQLDLLQRLEEAGAPWNAVDQCRIALTRSLLCWNLGNLEQAGQILVATANAGALVEHAEPLLLGWIELCRGLEAYIRSNHQQAMRLCENAVKNLRTTEEKQDLAIALLIYAEVANILNARVRARDAYLEAQTLYASVGNARRAALLDITLVGLDWDSPEEKAVRSAAFFEAMEYFRREGNRDAIVLGTIELVNNALLPPEEMLAALDEVEYIVKERGDGLAEFAFAHLRLELYYKQKDYASAVVHGRQALALARALGDKDYERWALVDLGLALLEMSPTGPQDEPHDLLLQGLQMNEAAGDAFYAAKAKLGLARIALARDELPAALDYAEAASAVFGSGDDPGAHQQSLSVLARIVGALGDHQRAHQLMREAFESSEEQADKAYHRILAETNAKYENELRNNALRLAQMEREIAEERLGEQAEELDISEALRARDRRFRNLSIVSGTGAGGLALVLSFLFFQRRKTLLRVEGLNEALRSETEALAHEAKQHEEANNELLAANFQLKLLDEERKSLLGMAAHDMRNPVGAIQSSLDLLEAELDQGPKANLDEIREYVSLASDASAILLESIERIIAARQQQNLQTNINLRHLDPRALIEQTVQMNQASAARKSMSIVLAEMPPVEVEADAQALRTSIDNLLSNAIKYSFPGAEIAVRLALEDDGSTIALSVSDGGPGIPQDEVDRLFQPFASLSNRPTGGERSTGLGLASVKSAVEAMGGTISAETAATERARASPSDSTHGRVKGFLK